MRVFYSWQSDTPNNKQYLQDCLDQAINDLSGVEIETATRNVPGAVDIAATIQTKINESDLFVADVSIIGETALDRKTPNPNVMYELGYALAKKGEGAIILIANKDTTETTDLPFDIRNRLIILKRFNSGNKNRLATELKEIISAHPPALVEETLEHPYIYLQLQGYTNVNNDQHIKLSTVSNENDEYVLEAIEIGGIEVGLRRAVSLGTGRTFQVHGLPATPFDTAYNKISFTVSRMNRTYLITQGLNVSSRADGAFNFDSLDPAPTLIRQVPKRRDCEIVVLQRMGDNLKVNLVDTETNKICVIGVSGTLLGIWGFREGRDEIAVKAVAKALNNQLQGNGEGEYMFTTTNSGNTLSNAIDLIYQGNTPASRPVQSI